MNRLFFLCVFLFVLSGSLHAQYQVRGTVLDEKASPLAFASVALLLPSDSSLVNFAVTDEEGHFEIKNIRQGKYLVQTAYVGFHPGYKNVEVPLAAGETMGVIVIRSYSVDLKETEVSADRIPILLKRDTVEYDAGAFKTQEDAVAEDLLKKLPGVEVDRAGNIKAGGEDVNNVLVDGKEFFGSDPKVATKNLPADAVKKVQVYNKKSDESELTGIDDGSRNKTINFVLKDDKKTSMFGDIQAGAGTDSHYQTSAKVYRFNKNSQFAALGMFNNINQFGFSFRDYVDFNGGIGNMMNGDGNSRVSLANDNSMPINFGQPVTGLITSGAGGLNYTYEKKKNNRFNISYLGNGTDKNLDENTFSRNFTSGNTFTQNTALEEFSKNRAQRVNLGWRNKPDSTQSIILNGNASLTNGKTMDNTMSRSSRSDTLLNDLVNSSDNKVNALSGNMHAAYLKKLSNEWKLFRISADGSGSGDLDRTTWHNTIHYLEPEATESTNQFKNNSKNVLEYSVGTSVMRTLYKSFLIQPEMTAGDRVETLKRMQGISSSADVPLDSISPRMQSEYVWMRPALSFKRSNSKSQFDLTAQAEAGKMSNELSAQPKTVQRVFYFTPRFSWDYEYKTSHRLRAYYESALNTPSVEQLLPQVNNLNPLFLYSGNRDLRPEYIHDAHLDWILFDQFSFTSLFAGINGTYTHDKINWSRTIREDLGQSLVLFNATDDYRMKANVEFSRPLRKLGISVTVNANESWNRGINYVNDVQNFTTSFTQEYTLSVNNRKKEKWDANAGSTVQVTDATYSVERSLNNRYLSVSWFTELNFNPDKHWRFTTSADVTRYDASSFGQTISVPILKASVTHYMLKANRGMVRLEVYDLLNRNTGIERISELNYLQEKRSNMIGRYVMLTLKYRLNKQEDSKNINIQVK